MEMENGNQELEALAKAIADRVRGTKPQSPKLRVVQEAPEPRPENADRKALIREIKYLSRGYRLLWMVNQATFRKGKLKDLDDGELVSLLKDMQRAIDCPDDDVSYKEAGLLKHLAV